MDKVTIVGLMDNSNVKITDLNGNIIYQTKSFGGASYLELPERKRITCSDRRISCTSFHGGSLRERRNKNHCSQIEQ